MDSHDRVDNGDGNMGSQQETPSLCAKGCGFFGTPATYNLCSKCYKDYLKEDITKALTQTPSMHSPDESISTSPDPSSRVSENTIDSTVSSSDDAWILKNRCQCCKKKVGLMGFGCRCGGLFCGRHRYPEEHSCTFEFKAAGRVALAKENPVCKADRLHRI